MTTRTAVVTIVALLLCSAAVSGCASRVGRSVTTPVVASGPRLDLSPKVALARDPAVTVRSYFGANARPPEILVRDKFKTSKLSPFVFWRVETETTPSASAVCATLLSMAQRYGGHGRSIDLRVDWGGRVGMDYPARQSAFFWNPTATQSQGWGYGMNPGPRSLGVWTGRGGNGPMNLDVVTFELSDVTTQTIVSAATYQGVVFEAMRTRTPLR